ncbi:MAG: hypothetical protein L6R39_005406 [Caloplaca ligustica]|nr:MAG: hypothetical protein L6R39_005406 [Caloplaca ligustica]
MVHYRKALGDQDIWMPSVCAKPPRSENKDDNLDQPLPLSSLPHRHSPKSIPDLPPQPECNVENVSKSVRKKRRRKIRVWEQVKREKTLAVQAAAPYSCLAILSTCRTILLEAFHVWYQNNTLNFARSEDLYDFIVSIGHARAYEIRKIRLDIPAQGWYDAKAKHALGGLVRLEKLVFVYNHLSPLQSRGTNLNSIGFPKIIAHLRGLQQVTFTDPEVEETEEKKWNDRGFELGMTDPIRLRMDELRRKLMTKGKEPKHGPPMVDLFNRLNMKNQSGTDTIVGKWEEHLGSDRDFD